MVEPSGVSLVELRRYVVGERCAVAGIHSTAIAIGELAADDAGATCAPEPHELGDQRWPVACACGRRYTELDAWIRQVTPLWRIVGQPAVRWGLRELPPGAMYRATWLEGAWQGPDGACLVVVTPAAHWVIDGVFRENGKAWTRTGTPPRVTAAPSADFRRLMESSKVLRERWHGELRDGVLVELP